MKLLAEKLCNSLGRDVELCSKGKLIEQLTLAWALQEIQLRLPCAGAVFCSAAEVLKQEPGTAAK